MTEQLPSIGTIRADIELALCYLMLCFFMAIKPENALFTKLEVLTNVRGVTFTAAWCVIFLLAAYTCLAIKPMGVYHAVAALPLAIFGSMVIVSLLLPGNGAIFVSVFMVFALYLFFKNIRLQQEARVKDTLLLKLTQQKEIAAAEAAIAKE